MKCSRCGRALKHESPNGMGPKCARAMLGAKPAPVHVERHVTPDANQAELFPTAWQRMGTAVRDFLQDCKTFLIGVQHE